MHQYLRNRNGAGHLAWRLISVLLLSIVLMGSAATAHAQTDRIFINEIVPFDPLWYNECAGEYIQFNGNLHIVFFEQISPSGNAVYKSQVNVQGVSGYGVDSGFRQMVKTGAYPALVFFCRVLPRV